MRHFIHNNFINLVAAILLLANTFALPFSPNSTQPVASAQEQQASGRSARPDNQQRTAQVEVSITDSGFVPEVITVTVGSEVTWVNVGSTAHGVSSPPIEEEVGHLVFLPFLMRPASRAQLENSGNTQAPAAERARQTAITQGAWNSGPLLPGQSFTRAFNEVGVVNYLNSEYPDLTGIVVVEPANEAPVISISTPAPGTFVGPGSLLVSGSVSDDGQIVEALVNGIPASITSSSFQATIPVTDGNEMILAEVVDDDGATGFDTVLILVDGSGPAIEIVSPRHRNSVYSDQPFLDIYYDDFGDVVNTGSLQVSLSEQGGGTFSVLGDLSVGDDRAFGTVSSPLTQDRVYSLTVSVEDALGNETLASSTFYVPASPGSLTRPDEGDQAGWISGRVFDSSTCDPDLTECVGLPGASVTIALVDTSEVTQLRAQRQSDTMARLSSAETFRPLGPSASNSATSPITGTVVTGPDGFFAFPLNETAVYWMRVEKEGYTYGQREVQVAREQSSTSNDIYLTPIDPVVTPCDDGGCSHTNSDASIKVQIPAGAIQSGQSVDVTATTFDNVEFLPSGDLPPGTWETYALNLGGASEITFTVPVTVQVKNALNFSPGTIIPLGYWNQNTLSWEHAGTGLVSNTGEWIDTAVTHFSNYDLNYPTQKSDTEVDTGGDEFDQDNAPDLPGDEEDEPCGDGAGGCFVNFKSGTLHEWVDTPPVSVLGQPVAQQLAYSSDRAQPSEVIDVRVSLKNTGSVQSLGYMGFELYIQGEKTAAHYIPVDLTAEGELGRLRYLWDGRDAQENRLPPGAYKYQVKLTFPYMAEYCRPVGDIFGNEPDCVNGGTGIFVPAEELVWKEGTVTLHGDADSPFGQGWYLSGMQQLYENEAGDIVIVDGQRHDEFYFPQKDKLLAAETALNSFSTLSALTGTGAEILQPDPEPRNRPAPFTPAERVDTQRLPTLLPVANGIPYSEQPGLSADSSVPTLDVCGEINSNTTWTLANSPYVVTCDVSVLPGVTLTIEPGVTVQLQNGLSLVVSGILSAQGSEGSPITFESSGAAVPASWKSIAFLDGSTGILDQNVVQHGGFTPASYPQYGAVTITGGDVSISNSTFQQNGVGIYAAGSATPDITDSLFTNNTGRYGGAIFATDLAMPTFTNSDFILNQASNRGGAVYAIEAALDIRGSRFISNSVTSGYGGAVAADWGTPAVIYNNHFEGNKSTGGGGGAIFIYNELVQTSIISNTFFNNEAVNHEGGAIYDESHQTIIQGNTFIANKGRDGGAVAHLDYFYTSNSALIEGNIFRHGQARNGGGLHVSHGDPIVRGNEFSQNTAEDSGGAIQTYGPARLEHNVLWNNVAEFGGGLANYTNDALPKLHNNIIVSNTATFTNANGYLGGGGIFGNSFLGFASLGDHNLVWGNAGLNYQELVPGPNDISADPLFVDPTNYDFHLQPSSPAIDSGLPLSGNTEDFEGDQRPMGVAPDVGLDEFRAFGVAKEASAQIVAPGEQLTYVVHVVNVENSPATVTLSDILPQAVSFAGYDSSDFSCSHDGASSGGTLSCSGELTAQNQGTISVTVVADDSLPAPVLLSNTITASTGGAEAADSSEVWLSWCNVQLNDGPIGHDIQAAIDASSSPDDVIKVSGRCHVPWGVGLSNRTMQGGWNSDFSLRMPVLYPTTLDAGYQGAAVYLSFAAVLEGFVVTHGADSGVYAGGASIVQDNIIEHNIGRAGGGVSTLQGASILRNVIRNNSAGNGGGLYSRTEDLNHLIDSNIIHDNDAHEDGGGIYIDWGGRVRNNIIFNNEAGDDGGGIYFDEHARAPRIEHNTLWGNGAGVRGGGMALVSNFGWSFSTIIRNNAVISNTAPSGGGVFLTTVMNGLDYNNVWANSPDDYNGGTVPPANSLTADPLFVDAQGGDFHIELGSPMIDAADPASDFFPDFEGDPRPMGEGGSDIGADEYPANSAFSRTGTDYSRLDFDSSSGTYTRTYLDGTLVHFDAGNRHDYTLSADGTRTTYGYDGAGNPVSISITAPGESSPHWIWILAYSGGKLTSITDPAGRVTSFTIDEHNHLVAAIHPDGATQSFAYRWNGLLSQHEDENGAVTEFSYDDYGRIAQIIDPVREVYDQASRSSSLQRVVRSITPSDTGYSLINDRPPGSPANPGLAVPLSVDLIDRIEYGRGEVSGRTDRWGFWASQSDGLGRTTRTVRNPDGSKNRIIYPDGDCAEFTYDENGNMLNEARMPADQCILAPADRDPSKIQTRSWTYEPRFNLVKSTTDPNGNTTEYLYDYEVGAGEAGRVIRITRPLVDDGSGALVHPIEQFSYNSWGMIDTEIDPLGTVTKYIYSQGNPDEASGGANPLFAPGVSPVPGILTQVIMDYGGENLTFTFKAFDGAGNPGFTSAPDGHEATTYLYDEMNRPIQEVDALGMVSRFDYDGRGNLIEKILDFTADGVTGRNVRTTYRYDAHDQRLQETTLADGLLVSMEYAYDINNQLALERDSRGAEKIYVYDLADQLVNVIDPEGHVITNTYSLDGNLLQTTDADGFVTEYEYDAFDRRIMETQDPGSLNLITTYAYDLKGNMVSFIDPDGVVTCASFDALNRAISRTSDCGGLNIESTYSYDLNGNQIAEVDHRGTLTTKAYDGLNRPILERTDDGGLNLEMTFSYDPAGNLFEITDEQGAVNRITYNLLNLVVFDCEDADGLNLCASYIYDRLHNQASITDPNGTTNLSGINAFGLEEQMVQDDGGQEAETTYLYDNALNLTAIIDPNGNQTRFVYNLRGERIRTHYADGTVLDEEFDGRGNVVSQLLQDGNTINTTYDGVGRMTARTFGAGNTQTFDYDAVGRLVYAEQNSGGQINIVSMTYNPIGDLISTTQTYDGDSWSVAYAHDYPAGEHLITYPSGAQRTYQYDPLNRISRVEREGSALVAEFAYFDVPGYQTITYGNGLVSRLDYDALGRATRVSSAVADYRYGYDGAGNRLYLQRAHETGIPADVYAYDGLNQLTQVWYGADSTDNQTISTFDSRQSFTLDDAGNRLAVQEDSTTETYLPNNGSQLTNTMNRYENVGGDSLTYDLRGNTLSDGTNIYQYDLLNRMTAVSGPGSAATYVYDALGRRLAKDVNGEITIFIYDSQGQVLEERSASDQLVARYTYGGELDEPISFERDGTTYYYQRDALGSVTEVTNAAGALVERYKYQVYGSVSIFDQGGTVLSESAVGNPYLFTSRRFDPESGNYYYRARAYSPDLGRFLQMDPLGFSDGINLYQYVRNQPVLLTDPHGLFAVKAGVSFKVQLLAGPLPWPGTWWRVRAFGDATFMKCCNQQTKRTEIWAQMKIGLTLEAVFGKTIGKKLEKLAKDSDKLKPGRTSESTDLSMFDSVGPCPDKGCNGFAEGFIEGKGGFGAGIKISAKVPLYPTVQAPKFAVTQYTGVMGVEISMGVKGGAVCVFRPGDIFEIF